MKSNVLPTLKFLIGWPFSLIALFFVFQLLYGKADEIKPYLENISYLPFVLGFVLFIVYFIFRNIIWLKLLNTQNETLSFKESTYRFSFSEIKRYIPGNIWSFLSRASLFQDAGITNKTIGTSIIADIQLVVIGGLIASIFSIPFMLASNETLIIKLSSILPISLIIIALYFVGTGYFYKRSFAKDSSLIKTLFLPGIKWNDKGYLITLSSICYFIFGLANYFILYSVIPTGNILILSSFFVFSLLVGYLSFFTPMGLGVREGIVTIGLSGLIGETQAAFVSIFTRICLIISELFFLLFIFVWHKAKN